MVNTHKVQFLNAAGDSWSDQVTGSHEFCLGFIQGFYKDAKQAGVTTRIMNVEKGVEVFSEESE